MTIIRCGIAIFALVIAANCAELSLPALAAAPGARLLLHVSFSSQSSAVTAIEFDLQYDSSTLSLCATAGESVRASQKILYFWDLAPGQRRFIIFGRNTDIFVGGILIDLFAMLNPDAPTGVYPLKLLNVVAADPAALAVNINAVNGVISVQEAARSNMRPALLTRACPTFSVLDSASVLFEDSAVPLPPTGKGSIQAQATPRSEPGTGLLNSVAVPGPSILIPEGSGIAFGVILNHDYSVNSPYNPAQKGTVIMLFANSDWPRVPLGARGKSAGETVPESALTVSVLIGGLAAQVFYPEAAPVLVDGVLQINCIVPLDSPSGVAVPVMFSAEKRYSMANVTVAIQ